MITETFFICWTFILFFLIMLVLILIRCDLYDIRRHFKIPRFGIDDIEEDDKK